MSVLSPSPPRGALALSNDRERLDAGSFKVFWDPQCELDHPTWVQAGRKLGVLGRGGQWWLGDWLLYGGFRWGQKYAEAARITGYDAGSLRNMAWMASQFPPPRRRASLTWCHHAAVAGLSLAEQERWLDLVAAERLTVADLRAALRAERAHREQAAPAPAAQVSHDSRAAVAPSHVSHDAVAQVICPHCGGEVPLPRGTSRPLGIAGVGEVR
ncbi:MAG TPA: hypothetical protein VNV42_15085 [Solirubrobacteraceae bacterium]|jgi:hypothetical protein|nr:hypothetical protein [Solirubrobacteraceae bacterium]